MSTNTNLFTTNLFELDVAKTLYDVPPATSKSREYELQVILRIKSFLVESDVNKIVNKAQDLDARYVSKLSGSGLLIVGGMIWKAAPDALSNMPSLIVAGEHIKRAQRLDEIFKPSALRRIAESLRKG